MEREVYGTSFALAFRVSAGCFQRSCGGVVRLLVIAPKSVGASFRLSQCTAIHFPGFSRNVPADERCAALNFGAGIRLGRSLNSGNLSRSVSLRVTGQWPIQLAKPAVGIGARLPWLAARFDTKHYKQSLSCRPIDCEELTCFCHNVASLIVSAAGNRAPGFRRHRVGLTTRL